MFPLTFGYGLRIRADLVKIRRTFLSRRYQYVSVVLIAMLIFGSYFFSSDPSVTKAASYHWTQNDWSGGVVADIADHNVNQAGWSNYESKDTQVAVSAQGNVALDQSSLSIVEHDTDSDFSGGDFSETEISGSGVAGKVGIRQLPSTSDRLDAGGIHSFSLKRDDTLWAWGANSYGQLGLGDTTNRMSPVQVGTETEWKSVSAGLYHTLAIKNDGTLWVSGRNNGGQLGLGDLLNSFSQKVIH